MSSRFSNIVALILIIGLLLPQSAVIRAEEVISPEESASVDSSTEEEESEPGQQGTGESVDTEDRDQEPLHENTEQLESTNVGEAEASLAVDDTSELEIETADSTGIEAADETDPSGDGLIASEPNSPSDANGTHSVTSGSSSEEIEPEMDTSLVNEEIAIATSSTAAEGSLLGEMHHASTATTSASQVSGESEISTGQAIALANILNLLNTNFVNSQGSIHFSNAIDTIEETTDLRSLVTSAAGGVCGEQLCSNQHDLHINIADEAYVQNLLLLQALSGGNTITNAEGATITTGNAYAGLNLVNIANTNVINSQYLLYTLNAFRDVRGDIVFPSLSTFFSNIAEGLASQIVGLSNSAQVDNNIITEADSGGNTAVHVASSTTITGNAHASATVLNHINASLLDSAVSVLFRVHGAWNGELFGVPDGYSLVREADGSFRIGHENVSQAASGSLTLTGSSTARIANNIHLTALSGENRIENAHEGYIQTGDAFAGANVINLVNSQIIGKNWMLAIVNIFGDFDGNLAFGRPDLWIGANVEAPSTIQNGSQLTYRFTVVNNGDAEMRNVRLMDDFDAEHIAPLQSPEAYSENDGSIVWELGTLAPGEAVQISYTAQVKDSSPDTEISNTIRVTGRETDNDDSDNTERITVRTAGSGNSTDTKIERKERESEDDSSRASLNMSRTEPSLTAAAGTMLREEIVIQNTGERGIEGVLVIDVLSDPSGKIIQEEAWDLGTVVAGEEIVLGYNIQFSQLAPRGVYTLSTRIETRDYGTSMFAGNGTIMITDGRAFLNEVSSTSPPLGFASSVAGTPPSVSLSEQLLEAFAPQKALAAGAAFAANDIDRYTLFVLSLALLSLMYVAGRWYLSTADEDEQVLA